ncbi:MAG: hypothetical protein ACK4VO_09775 [Pseudobdellovibrio sp.]
MKLAVLYVLFLSIFFTTSCQSNRAIAQQGGGADTGGGNTIGSAKVTAEEVKKYIEKSKDLSVYIFRRKEFLLLSPQHRGSSFELLGKKLFKGQKSIYQALIEAVIRPVESGPCYDSQGKEVDASAKDAPNLCFSLERLSARLNADSVQSEVLAIVAHELSHMVGTTESEAKFLQGMVKDSLANDPYNKLPKLIKQYKSNVNDALDNVNYLSKKVDALTVQELCVGLSVQLPLLNQLLQNNLNSLTDNEKNGIAYSSSKEISAIQATLLKSINSLTFCNYSNPDYQEIVKKFNGRDKMLLPEFQMTLYPDEIGMITPPNWIIRRLYPMNLNSLKLELFDMSNALKNILSSI